MPKMNGELKEKMRLAALPKNITDYNAQFRKKYIPKRYNQIELVDQLENEDLDHYISISNRSDGKSFNYMHYFIRLSMDFKVNFMLVARHFTLRKSYVQMIRKIVTKCNDINGDMIRFRNDNDFYVTCLYGDRPIGIITDLNTATDLKYFSNYLSDYPIIIYDEFLALDGDYLPDEWDRLKTIYSSINREPDIPIIKFPKLFYLGNAVNFSSPILAQLNLYNKLENHPINTLKIYGNIALEMHNNTNANEERNLRAFNEEHDTMTTGRFETNAYNVANDNERKALVKDSHELYIKLDSNYLRIKFTSDYRLILLAIIGYAPRYDFNYRMKDNREDSVYLKDTFFNENQKKLFIHDYYKFENTYSKDYILTDFNGLNTLKIMKILSIYLSEKQDSSDYQEERYQENYLENSLNHIKQKFLDWI